MKVFIFLTALISLTSNIYAADFYSTNSGNMYAGARWATTSGGVGSPKTDFTSSDNLFIESGHTIDLPNKDNIVINNLTIYAGGTLSNFTEDNNDITINNLIILGSLDFDDTSISGCKVTVTNIYFIGSNYSFTRSETNTTVDHSGIIFASSKTSQTPPSDVTNITGNGQLSQYMQGSVGKNILHLASGATSGTLENLPSSFSTETSSITLNSNFTLTVNTSVGSSFSVTAGSNTNVEFIGNSSGTFIPSGVFNNITMNTSSDVTLGNDLEIAGTLTLTDGVLTTGSNSVTVRTGGSISGLSTQADPDDALCGGSDASHIDGTLIMSVSATNNYVFLPVGDNANLRTIGVRNLVGSPSNFVVTAKYNKSAHSDYSDTDDGDLKMSNIEYWDISVSGTDVNGSPNFNVVLTYDDNSEVNTGKLGDLHVMHYRSGQWHSEGSGGSGASHTFSPKNNIANVNGFFEAATATFSPFGFGGGADQDLPIELTSFEAKQDNNEMVFSWETAQEINNDFFELEGSKDKRSTNTIVKIDGAGNTQTERKYKYNASAFEWNPYQYFRLKQTDFDGTYTFSEWIEINNSAKAFDFYLYPNPSHDIMTINTVLGQNDTIETIQIVDLQGKQLSRMDWENHHQINTSFLDRGIYIMILTSSSGERKIHRFTVQ